jgi:hypothetical protein
MVTARMLARLSAARREALLSVVTIDLDTTDVETSHAPNLSSCLLGRVVVGGGEGDVFVVVLPSLEAVV